jgi:predicted RNA-binding protein
MCESTVYLLEGGTKKLVMQEAARVSVIDADAVVIGLSGEQKTLVDVELSDADLMRHEIVLRPRKG